MPVATTKSVCGICGALQRANDDESYTTIESHYTMCVTGQYGGVIDIEEKPEDWVRPTEAEHDEEFVNPTWQSWAAIERNRKTGEWRMLRNHNHDDKELLAGIRKLLKPFEAIGL